MEIVFQAGRQWVKHTGGSYIMVILSINLGRVSRTSEHLRDMAGGTAEGSESVARASSRVLYIRYHCLF